MAEFIMEFPVDSKPESIADVHERIVRCRDCKHFNYVDKVCDRFGEYPSAVGAWFAVNHSGFCAWGEPREE